VNDELLYEADRVAGEIGVGRSRLFSLALEQFLRDRHNDELLDQLNRVCGDSVEERQNAAAIKRKFHSVIKDRW